MCIFIYVFISMLVWFSLFSVASRMPSPYLLCQCSCVPNSIVAAFMYVLSYVVDKLLL